MRIFGIVCEYNPFHTGHLYHIGESRRLGADAIVCVMSGNYVQRADFAMLDMHSRAECAIRNGADLVIQLPTPWVLSSAEKFAFGAVYILNAMGNITHLSFGAETENTELHIKAAKLLLYEDFSEILKNKIKTGVSFAAARESAVSEFDSELAALLKKPNNILAIEYIKSILKLNSDILPIAVERKGSHHDELSLSHEYLSATAIRYQIEKLESDKISRFLPRGTLEILQREKELENAPVWISKADTAILSCLKKLNASDYLSYSDVSEGLEKRLSRAVCQATTLNEAVMLAKTKRYAHSRLRRIYLSAFLGLTRDLSEGVPSYARILAFNKKGRNIISGIKKSSKIPIITKPAAVKRLGGEALRLFEFESRVTDIYSIFKPVPKRSGSEWTTSPKFIDE